MIDNYNQVSVGLYAKLVALAEGGRDEADLEAVALLSGKSTDELLQMPIPEYTVLRAKAAFLYYEPTKHPLRDAYQCGPYKLVLVKDERKLTTAQYCDFQEYSKQEGDHLPEMLSVFLIPEGCTYNEGYDILDVQAAIRDNLCFLDAYAVADFFRDTVSGINARFPNLFGKDSEQTEGQDEAEDTADEGTGDGGFTAKWGWVRQVDAVSELTRSSWAETYKLPALTFLNLICYRNDKLAEEKRQYEEQLRKNKH